MPDTMQVKEIAVAEIIRNEAQPRKFFDPAALTELAESIKQNGLLQPITVRPTGQPKAPYMIVVGERRWRAMQEAGKKTVPAVVLGDTADLDAFVLAVSENVNREDMTILEEAEAYANLAGAGWTADKIAAQFGKTPTHVQWRLGLLTLHPEIKTMVDKGEIKPNLAWHIAQLSPQNQLMAAGRYIRGDFESEIEAANFAQGLRMAENQTSLVAGEAPTVAEKEKRAAQKKEAEDKLAVLGRIMPLIDELTEVEPKELAVILGADLARYVREWDRFTNRVQLVRRVLRQADGIAKAVEATVAEGAKADAPKPEAKPDAPAEPKPEAKKPAARRTPAKKTATAKPAAKGEDSKPEVKATPATVAEQRGSKANLTVVADK